MKIFRYFLLLFMILYLILIAVGIYQGTFFHQGSILINLYWGRFTLYDFYGLVITLILWVWYRESRILPSLLWSLGLLFVGSPLLMFYMYRISKKADGNWRKFFLGKNY